MSNIWPVTSISCVDRYLCASEERVRAFHRIALKFLELAKEWEAFADDIDSSVSGEYPDATASIQRDMVDYICKQCEIQTMTEAEEEDETTEITVVTQPQPPLNEDERLAAYRAQKYCVENFGAGDWEKCINHIGCNRQKFDQHLIYQIAYQAMIIINPAEFEDFDDFLDVVDTENNYHFVNTVYQGINTADFHLLEAKAAGQLDIFSILLQESETHGEPQCNH